MHRMPYLSDPKLIPRVQKYLEANVDKTYVDIGLMADELQTTYREYSRRKRNAFRASVKKAYSIVLRSYGLEDQNDSSSDEEVEEAESENSREERFQSNLMNSQLVELYSRSSMNVPKMNDNELIDISSDDSKEENQPTLAKASNGPSTSIKLIRPDFPNDTPSNFPEIVDSCEKITVIQGKKRKLDNKSSLQVKKKRKMLAITSPTAAPEVPKVTFEDVVGIDGTLARIEEILCPVLRPDVYEKFDDKSLPPRGILLHGPSGCGKTLLAYAIAGQLNYPLIKVAATELVAGISGESEKLIKELFEKSVSSSPCVLFIDNIDVITNNQSNSQKDMQKRIVSQFSYCLDELDKNPLAEKVILIGATAYPGSMDPSLRRFGRFSNEIRLGIPNEESRIAILKLHTSSKNLEQGLDWNHVGAVTPGFVGADLVALIKEANKRALFRFLNNNKNYLLKSRKTEIPSQHQNSNTEERDSDKNETEIIVDDDPKETVDKNKPISDQEENLVLVIEDENSKEGNEDISSSTVPTETNNSDETVPATTTEKANEIIPEPVVDPVDSCSSSNWNWTRAEKFEFMQDENGFSEHLIKSCVVTEDDFLQAAKVIKPSSIREGLASIPNICWDDVGSLKDIKEELMSTLLGATKHKKRFEHLRLTTPAGVLLCGPPGCGKTLVAKALANEARINFISVKGPELLNMYVGESEKAVRMCFERAKNSAPCVIFFDELDSLCPRRSTDREGDVSSRVVNQMLTEMDGVEERKGVYLLAATNKPDRIDPAVLRPGRLDKILYVGIPSPADRLEILKTITKNCTKPPISSDVNLESLCSSEKLSCYTGADLSALVTEAARIHYKRTMDVADEDFDGILTNQDFEEAIAKIRPSVSEEERTIYKEMKKLYTPTVKNDLDEGMDLS